MAINIDQELITMYGDYFYEKREQFQDEVPSFRPYRFGFVDPWLESLANLFLALPKEYLLQHRKLVADIVTRIREKSAYYFFLDALKAIEGRFNLPFPLYLYELREARPTIASFLMTELLLVWALMEKDGKLLVCVRNGFQRKRFPLPDDPYNRRKSIAAIGHHILAVLPFIESRDVALLIPDRFGPLLEGVDPEIQLPVFDGTIDEVLADARSRQRYTVDSGGALVHWKKRGADLKEMFIKVIDGVVIAKVVTSAGGTLAFLNLENYKGLDFIISKEGPKNPLALDLAAVYHKLVTAKEIRVRRETKLEIPTLETMAERPGFSEEGPTVIYIPRTILVEQAGIRKTREVLPRQPMHHESPIDHARYLKGRGEMSVNQRQRIEEFERIKGKRILDWLQPGWTYVLPHDWREKTKEIIYLAVTVEPQLPQLKTS